MLGRGRGGPPRSNSLIYTVSTADLDTTVLHPLLLRSSPSARGHHLHRIQKEVVDAFAAISGNTAAFTHRYARPTPPRRRSGEW